MTRQTFTENDKIEFAFHAFAPEEATYCLPKLRERLYFVLNIFELNDKPLERPTLLECGIFIDELPKNIKIQKKDGGLSLDGLDPKYLYTTTLKSGLARADETGIWGGLKTGPFLELSTLKRTDKLATQSPHQQEMPAEKALTPTEIPQKTKNWANTLIERLRRAKTRQHSL